jgi:hypothetical protein
VRKIGLVWLALLIVIMLAPGLASAQDDEALDTVTTALNNLAALDGYHYTSESIVTNEFIEADDSRNASATHFYTIGSVNGDGDYQTTLIVGAADEEQATSAPLQIDRIMAGGVLYVNLSSGDSLYEDYYGVTAGWWRYDDLSAMLDNQTAGYALNTIIQRPLPSTSPALSSEMIISAEERAADTLDGLAMRVFDIHLDARRIMMETRTNSAASQIGNLFEDLAVLAEGTFSISARLWIGANDGQLYRVQAGAKTILPYVSSGHEDLVPYDLRQTEETTLIISEHGQPVEISAPFPVNE